MSALGYSWYMTSVGGTKNVCKPSYKPKKKVLGTVPQLEVFMYLKWLNTHGDARASQSAETIIQVSAGHQ